MHTPSTYTYTYLHFLNGRPVFVEVKVLSHALSYQSLSSPAALPVASNQRNSAKSRGRRLDAGPCQEGRRDNLLCPCCCGGSRVHHSHSPNSGGHLEKILDTSKINNRTILVRMQLPFAYPNNSRDAPKCFHNASQMHY